MTQKSVKGRHVGQEGGHMKASSEDDARGIGGIGGGGGS